MKTKVIFGADKEEQVLDFIKEIGRPKYAILFEKENGKPFAAWAYDGRDGGTLIFESTIKRMAKQAKLRGEKLDLSSITHHHRYAGSADAFDKFMRVMRAKYEI